VQFLKIEVQDAAALQPQGIPQHICGDEGIAVAIPPDPAANPKK
jgi:hypothetical protein